MLDARPMSDRGAPLTRVRLPDPAPALVYLGGQLLVLWVVAVVSVLTTGESLLTLLTSWDGQHLLRIARLGYAPSVVAGEMQGPGGSIAFFPGYPLTVRAVSTMSGLPNSYAALAISLVCGVLTSYGLVRLVDHLRMGDRRAGLLLVALYSLAPLSVVLSMAYTESMFCALAVWCLVAVLEGRWVLAGCCAVVAGTVRPTGLVLAAVVVVAGALATVGRRRLGAPAVAAGLAPLGAGAYGGWIWWTYGSPAVYGDVQMVGWGSHFDGGAATLRFIARTVLGPPAVMDVVIVALLGVCGVLVWATVRQRAPLVVVLYGVLVWGMDLASDGIMNSKARLLVPAFTLMVPVALWLSRQSASVQVAAVGGVAVAGSWFSAYALVIYPYAI